MPRKARVEFAGAIYHLLDRGDRREAIFRDDIDRRGFLRTLAEVCARTPTPTPTPTATPKAAKPVYNPTTSTGSHPPSTLYVNVSTTSSGTQLRWTNDGTIPTPSYGNFINGSSGTITVWADTSVTLKTIAYGAGYLNSDVASSPFDQTDHAPNAAAPAFTPPSSNGASPPSNLTVTISTASSGATMRYTKDGSTPSQSNGVSINGTSGTTTILANTSVTLKAIAYGAAYKDSTITSALFDRVDHTTTCVAPVFNPSGCSGFTGGLLPVSVSTTTSGAKIHYTENGTDPSDTVGLSIDGMSGTVWIGTVVPITLKAVAYKSGSYTSPITSGYYDNEDPGGGGHAPDGSNLVTYTLDSAGNRTKVVDGTTTVTYVPNNLNEYGSVGSESPTYGPNGSLTGYGGWTYVFDADKRVTSATGSGHSVQFVYDGLGRCVQRTLDGTATYFSYDGWKPIAEWDGIGNLIAWNLYGPGADEILMRYQPSGTAPYLHYHADQFGNVKFLLDGNNVGVEKYTYDAYGAATITDWSGVPRSGSAYNNRFMYNGREYLSEAGIYDYRARSYLPSLGRFLQPDPIGFAGDPANLYRYCGNNPINLSDPTGEYFRQPRWNPDGSVTIEIPVSFEGPGNTAAARDAYRSGVESLSGEYDGVNVNFEATDPTFWESVTGRDNRVIIQEGFGSDGYGDTDHGWLDSGYYQVSRVFADGGISPAGAFYDAIQGAAHEVLHFLGFTDAYNTKTGDLLPGVDPSDILGDLDPDGQLTDEEIRQILSGQGGKGGHGQAFNTWYNNNGLTSTWGNPNYQAGSALSQYVPIPKPKKKGH